MSFKFDKKILTSTPKFSESDANELYKKYMIDAEKDRQSYFKPVIPLSNKSKQVIDDNLHYKFNDIPLYKSSSSQLKNDEEHNSKRDFTPLFLAPFKTIKAYNDEKDVESYDAISIQGIFN
jgi:hypothetical protein